MTTDVRGRCGAILLVVNLLILILATPAPVSAQKNLLLFGQRTTPKKTSESATWQQWDAFLTFAITKIGQMLPPESRGALADLLLNARYELADALVSPTVSAEALVPQLFFSAMQQLSPALRSGLAGVTTGNASQISHFASAVDSMNAFGPMGFRTGLVKLTPNTLRGLAYMVNPGTNQDPIAYNTGVDPDLRGLLGFGAAMPESGYDPFQYLTPPSDKTGQDAMRLKLNTWVPRRNDIGDYLTEVRVLLSGLASKSVATSKMSKEFRELYAHMVFATAWQESCWRQFVRKGKKLQPLTWD